MRDDGPAPRLLVLSKHLQPASTAAATAAPTKLAVIGAGSWAVLNHLPQLAAIPGVEVVALMDASA